MKKSLIVLYFLAISLAFLSANTSGSAVPWNNSLFKILAYIAFMVVCMAVGIVITFNWPHRVIDRLSFNTNKREINSMSYSQDAIIAGIIKLYILGKVIDVEECDYRKLSIDDSSVRSILLDPSFVSYKNNKEFELSLKEFYRILQPKGLLLFKGQDTTKGDQVKFLHIDAVYKPVIEAGFKAVDLFIMAAKWRPVSVNQAKNQKHDRKFYNYFQVFEKID